jgi:hypothetical protein
VPLPVPEAEGTLGASEVFVGSKALGAASIVDDERAVLILLDNSFVHELRHEVHGGLTLTLGVLHLSNLRLQDVVLRKLSRLPQLLLLLGSLIVRDLLLGSSSLAACLEQVGRDALVGYNG